MDADNDSNKRLLRKLTGFGIFIILIMWVVSFSARLAVPYLREQGWQIEDYAFINERSLADEGVLTVDSVDDLTSLASLWTNELLIDGSGQIWLSTEEGVARRSVSGEWVLFVPMDSTFISPISQQVLIAPGHVQDLALDGLGQLWVASGRGLSRRSADGAWSTFPGEMLGVGSGYLAALAIDSQNRVWTGASRGTITLLTPQEGGDYLISQAPTNMAAGHGNFYINNLAFDAKDRLWAATNVGLFALDPANGRVVQSAFTGQFIENLAHDNNRGVYLGTSFSSSSQPGLYSLKPDGSQKKQFAEDYWHAPAPEVAVDKQGVVWALRYGELNMKPPDGLWRHYFSPLGLRHLALGPTGRVWSTLQVSNVVAVDQSGQQEIFANLNAIMIFDEQKGSALKGIWARLLNQAPT